MKIVTAMVIIFFSAVAGWFVLKKEIPAVPGYQITTLNACISVNSCTQPTSKITEGSENIYLVKGSISEYHAVTYFTTSQNRFGVILETAINPNNPSFMEDNDRDGVIDALSQVDSSGVVVRYTKEDKVFKKYFDKAQGLYIDLMEEAYKKTVPAQLKKPHVISNSAGCPQGGQFLYLFFLGIHVSMHS